MRDTNHAASLLDDRARVDRRPGVLRDRHGFSGKRSLIDHDVPLIEDPVQRQHMSGADTDSVSDTDLRQRHLCLLSVVRQKPDPVHMKRHVLRKIVYGFFMSPCIQRITESQQEAHRSRR